MLFISFVAFTTLFSCNSPIRQESLNIDFRKKSLNIQVDSLKNFDVVAYERKILEDSDYEGYTNEDGAEVKIFFIPKIGQSSNPFNKGNIENYVEQISYSSGVRDLYTYYSSGKLKIYEQYFSIDLPIGIWSTYSERGELISSVNKDEGYTFTLDDVVKFGKDRGVNLREYGEIKKGIQNNQLIWIIEMVAHDEKSKEDRYWTYVLDGNSGQILKQKDEIVPEFTSK